MDYTYYFTHTTCPTCGRCPTCGSYGYAPYTQQTVTTTYPEKVTDEDLEKLKQFIEKLQKAKESNV